MFKRVSALLLSLCLLGLTATACGNSDSSKSSSKTSEESSRAETEPTTEIKTNLPKIDMSKWLYSEDQEVYYQIGVSYCEKPADETYEKLSVFVPAAYMDGTANGDGTFTCNLNGKEINSYTSSTAPIVMPINTPGYASDPAFENDEELIRHVLGEVTKYTSTGFVFVHSGCRGIDEGAPAGVTDLKAAIRYLRYCDDVIAGDAEKLFVFGMSGGGAQAAILGAAGDSELYTPYLKSIGAVEGVSDSVFGAMTWCPITDLDTVDAEYEWMMGSSRTGRSKEEQAISDSLAEAFADYVNSAGFTDKNGNALTLTKSEDGIYQAGSYYDYIKSEIERSLNNYLSDSTASTDDAQKYIDSLNADEKWISYDKSTNTAKITSIKAFVKHCKNPSDFVVAFDKPKGENPLFGYGDCKGAHFDKILADILTKLNIEYAAEYNADLAKTDSFGNSVEYRVNMYTPLYYLMKSRGGFGKSRVAENWRIRTGIEQMSTSVTTEINLALALEHYDGVKSVDFETVWALDHTEAERTGESTDNFIEWVKACSKA